MWSSIETVIPKNWKSERTKKESQTHTKKERSKVFYWHCERERERKKALCVYIEVDDDVVADVDSLIILRK